MASKPFVTHSLQDDGAWNFAWYYASLRSPWKFSRIWTAEDEDKDKDKDKDKDFSSKDKDKDLKIGPRGSSRTTTFLEDNNTVFRCYNTNPVFCGVIALYYMKLVA